MGSVGSTGVGFEAVKTYAEYCSGKKENAVANLMELIRKDSDNNTVQVIGGMMLFLEGRVEEALELLQRHENNLEAYEYLQRSMIDFRIAIIIYIRLTQWDIEAAEKELNGTKTWAQDTMLQQLAEVVPIQNVYIYDRPG